MSVETDADAATESATVQESQDSMRQKCEMHGVVVAAQSSVEEALVSNRGSFSIKSVSSLTKMSKLGGSITYFSVTELHYSS